MVCGNLVDRLSMKAALDLFSTLCKYKLHLFILSMDKLDEYGTIELLPL